MVESDATIGEASESDGWKPWSASERESFFEAIARNGRASWQITSACVVAVAVLTAVVAVLLSPLLIGLAGLTLDVVNVAIPMPDLLGALGRRLDTVLDEKTFSAAGLIQLTALAAMPGFALMGVASTRSRPLTAVLGRRVVRSPARQRSRRAAPS
jgi:hypothetical protein